MTKGSWREFDNPVVNDCTERSSSLVIKADRPVRVQRTRAGKKGKTVTVITGLGLNNSEAKLLLKTLKTCCGTGGTIKTDSMELNGDQVSTAMALLRKEGFSPKQAGG